MFYVTWLPSFPTTVSKIAHLHFPSDVCHLLIIFPPPPFFCNSLSDWVRLSLSICFLLYLLLICTAFAKHAFISLIFDADVVVLSSMMPHGRNGYRTLPPILLIGAFPVQRLWNWSSICQSVLVLFLEHLEFYPGNRHLCQCAKGLPVSLLLPHFPDCFLFPCCSPTSQTASSVSSSAPPLLILLVLFPLLLPYFPSWFLKFP